MCKVTGRYQAGEANECFLSYKTSDTLALDANPELREGILKITWNDAQESLSSGSDKPDRQGIDHICMSPILFILGQS